MSLSPLPRTPHARGGARISASAACCVDLGCLSAVGGIWGSSMASKSLKVRLPFRFYFRFPHHLSSFQTKKSNKPILVLLDVSSIFSVFIPKIFALLPMLVPTKPTAADFLIPFHSFHPIVAHYTSSVFTRFIWLACLLHFINIMINDIFLVFPPLPSLSSFHDQSRPPYPGPAWLPPL